MRIARNMLPLLAAACVALVCASAVAGDFDDLFGQINVRAKADLGAFKVDLAATFGTSEPKINGLFEIVSDPADVYMILRIGELAHQPIDRVVAEHREHAGQGWGVIAKNLGIKPGSDEFHALKNNRLSSGSRGGSSDHKGKGKGKS